MGVRHRKLGYARFLAGILVLSLLTLSPVLSYLHSFELNRILSSVYCRGGRKRLHPHSQGTIGLPSRTGQDDPRPLGGRSARLAKQA